MEIVFKYNSNDVNKVTITIQNKDNPNFVLEACNPPENEYFIYDLPNVLKAIYEAGKNGEPFTVSSTT